MVLQSLSRAGALQGARDEAPLAAGARIHFPLCHFEGFVAAPLQRQVAIDQGLEYALGRGRDFDLADDCILVGSDYGLGFDAHRFFAYS